MLSTDPIDLLLDVDGDIVIDSDLRWATGLPAIAQGIRIQLQLVKGEWFLDLDDGVPYYEREGVTSAEALLGGRFNQARATAAFRAAILRAPGVNTITSLAVAFDGSTRQLTVTWAVRTTFGDTLADALTRGV